MRRLFLRTWLLVAVVAVLTAIVGHLLMAFQLRRVVEHRVEQALQAPLRMARDRLDASPQPSPPPASSADAEQGRTLDWRNDPELRERMRRYLSMARELEEGLRLPVRVIPMHRLDLASTESEQLAGGAAISRVERGNSLHLLALDEQMVLVVGPVRTALPPRALLIQLGVLGVILASILVTLMLAQRPIERRLSRLAQAAAALAEGRREARSGVRGEDTIGMLGEQFDGMAERISRLLEHREELLRSVSHELRTPLARLYLLEEELQEPLSEPQRAAVLKRVRSSLSEMNTLVGELLEFARLESDLAPKLCSVEVEAIAQQLGDQLQADADRLTVTVEGDGSVQVLAEERLLGRALSNLVQNAGRHASSAVRIGWAVGARGVQIDVDDDGVGVPTEVREQIFEPFVRLGDEARRGSAGLGLAIARRAVEAMGGQLVCLEAPMGGARFRITLSPG